MKSKYSKDKYNAKQKLFIDKCGNAYDFREMMILFYDELIQIKFKLHMEKEYIEKMIKRGDDDLSLFRRLEDIDREVLIVNREIDRYNEVEE